MQMQASFISAQARQLLDAWHQGDISELNTQLDRARSTGRAGLSEDEQERLDLLDSIVQSMNGESRTGRSAAKGLRIEVSLQLLRHLIADRSPGMTSYAGNA